MGGLPALARLAVLTGGRLTPPTNDLTLGFARAQRDLACVYSLGFYDDQARLDRRRRVVIELQREGLRAVHPELYAFRSRRERQESLLQAAFVAPEMFQTGVARAHIFPVRPESPRRWEAMLAVSFPVFVRDEEGLEAVRKFGVTLRSDKKILRNIDRTVTLRPKSGRPASRRYVTFLEPVTLKPGEYEVTMVLYDPGTGRPHTALADLTVPEVRRGRLTLSGPILGREAGDDMVITSKGPLTFREKWKRQAEHESERDELGDRESFSPLLVQQIDRETRLLARTQACLIGSPARAAGTLLVRGVDDADGRRARALPPVEVALEKGGGGVHCQDVLDGVPTGLLPPGGYVFEASLTSAEADGDATDADAEGKKATARFSVRQPSASR